jgi:predicted flap endonuclease-1-like 5' DNA nuclease
MLFSVFSVPLWQIDFQSFKRRENMNWLVFIAGVLVGWLIGWLIDYFYWRRRRGGEAGDTSACRHELAAAQAQLRTCRERNAELEAQLAARPMPEDDLTQIEGIGPKIQEILGNHGIHTFAQLAAGRAEHLHELLEGAGSRFRMADPATWPEQAQLAADSQWEKLADLQDRLKGGRRGVDR